MFRHRRRIFSLLLILVLLAIPLATVRADPPGNTYYYRTWERTDYPVADGAIARTWMWGPEAFTPQGQETYRESPGASRTIQYFDKSRMEITDPAGDSASPWFVTNGLLVVEMIQGLIQLGDADFAAHAEGPAQVNVAGDRDDPTGPTYETFTDHLFDPPRDPGTLITQRINRVGTVSHDASLASYNISAGFLDVVTNHTIAAPFWDFMNSTGLVYEDGAYTDDDLFLNPFYATGRPITEAFWANVKVAGSYQDVLMQCFERRCLTFTPDNDPNWRVEAGNVGRHYYEWLYGEAGADPPNWGLSLYQSNYEDWTEWPTGTYDESDDRWLGDPVGRADRCADGYCLEFFGESNVWMGARGDLPEYGDVALASQIRMADAVAANDRGCLLTRVDQSGADIQLYALCLLANRQVVAFYYENVAGTETSEWLIPPGSVSVAAAASEWHVMAVMARGHDFWFYVDDYEPIGPIHHEGPLTGHVGVGMQRLASGVADTQFHFNFLRVFSVH